MRIGYGKEKYAKYVGAVRKDTTKLLIGHTNRSRFVRAVCGSTTNKVLKKLEDVQVIVTPNDYFEQSAASVSFFGIPRAAAYQTADKVLSICRGFSCLEFIKN